MAVYLFDGTTGALLLTIPNPHPEGSPTDPARSENFGRIFLLGLLKSGLSMRLGAREEPSISLTGRLADCSWKSPIQTRTSIRILILNSLAGQLQGWEKTSLSVLPDITWARCGTLEWSTFIMVPQATPTATASQTTGTSVLAPSSPKLSPHKGLGSTALL